MTDSSPLGWPCIAWAASVGDYGIQCWFQEQPRGTFTVTIRENGKELQREVVTATGPDAWEKPWTHAEQLRQAYDVRITQRMRQEWARLQAVG